MPSTIIATAGASDANAYCTVAFADAYNDNTPFGADWADVDDDIKAQSIITATRMLDQQFEWRGWIKSTSQALGWPRGGLYDRELRVITDSAIPVVVQNATAELARWLTEDNRESESIFGYDKIKVGPIELALNRRSVRSKIPEAVVDMLRDYGVVRSKKRLRLVRT